MWICTPSVKASPENQKRRIDALYDRLDEVKPEKLREKLAEHRDQVFMGRDLSTIVRDLPTEGAAEGEEAVAVGAAPVAATKPRVVVTSVIEYPADAVSNSLTAALVVAVAVMWFGGLGAAALVRGVTPAILRSVYDNLLVFAGGSLVACGIAAGATYFLATRSRK